MKSRITALLASFAIGGTLVFASIGVAGAAGPTAAGPAGKGVCAAFAVAVKAGATADKLHAFANCEIDRRVVTLNALSARITAAKSLTSSDSAALKDEVASTRSGLTSLKATIDAETDIPALRADIAKIVSNYRVYVLVAPQVHLVIAADAVLATRTKFADINTKLAARIATAKTAGKNTDAAQADLNAMNAAVTAAVGLAGPLPAQLLPLTPAQYNGGTAGPILTSARSSLTTARSDLKNAVADAKACRAALKAL
jgi:hypothetical protein